MVIFFSTVSLQLLLLSTLYYYTHYLNYSYRFYNDGKKTYGNKAQLLFTDTDTLMHHVKTPAI